MIASRSAAISAIVAGVIASSLCALTVGAAAVLSFIRLGAASYTLALVAVTILFLIAAAGIWRHMLSAATLGAILVVAGLGWALWIHQTVAVTLLVVPILGGLLSSVRGILALRRRA
jgi:hypothetical protein